MVSVPFSIHSDQWPDQLILPALFRLAQTRGRA